MLKDSIPLDQLRRALVIKLRHHGDVLMTSPVFSVLKNAVPGIEIDALIYADTAPMLEYHPAIAELHRIDRRWRSLGAAAQALEEWRLFRRLRQRRYDLLIHLTEHPRGSWLARGLGVRWSVAPRVGGRGRSWERSFTHLVERPYRPLRHTVELQLDALRRIGVQPGPDERGLVLVPGAAAEERVAALLSQHGLAAGAFVHIHPASRWLFKCWPAEAWAQVIEALHARGLKSVMSCAPDAAERGIVADIVARLGCPVVDLGGQLGLKDLAALTGQARLFLGVDSAPMHIAAAMKTPSIALFGPSGEAEWRPWGTPREGAHRVVVSQHSCRPCGIDGCGGGKVSECLTGLPAAAVVAAVDQFLGR